ncbi:MAG: phage tail tape measure protein [Porcipelethomonas sp.]
MAYAMSSIIRLIDEASPVLNNIGSTGTRVVAGLEEGFVRVNSAVDRAAKAISDSSEFVSKFESSTSGITTQSEYLAAAIANESEELRRNAQSLQLKADKAERAAESERRHYEEIQKEIDAEENASDALKEKAEATLKEAVSLEKTAEAWRKEADAAEQAYIASENTAASAADTIQAEEKLADSLNQTVQMENKVAEACANTDAAMAQTSGAAVEAAASVEQLSGNTSGVVTASRLFADALAKEAEKLEQSAISARNAAEEKRKIAQEASEVHKKLKEQIETSDVVTDALAEQAEQARQTAKTFDDIAKRAEQRAQKLEAAATASRKNASAAEEAAAADEQLYNSAVKVSTAEQQAAEALNRTEHEAEEYADSMKEASDSSRDLGSQGENTAQLLESAFMALGVERVITGIKDAFVACSQAAIEYESALTGVYKTVDGTDEQLAQISDDIKSMALEIPSTTTEIAGVAESAGQLGIATDNITDFTEVMINLGEATNLSSDEAASSLAKFSNITGMAAGNYENLGSAVVALGNNFATTEADIVAMATRMASAGTLAGLTESDILGLAAAMSSVGIEAEAGGSAMSTLMTDIQVAVETGNDSLNDFASVAGMTAEQFSDLFENRAVDALNAFITGLNDVERNGQTATVILENMGITEVRLSNAVKSLASNSDGLSGAVRLASEAWEENTALAEEAGTRYGTLESRLAITKNAANNLEIAIGDALNPVVGELADIGMGVLTWLTEFCEEHPAVVTSVTGVVGALALASKGVLSLVKRRENILQWVPETGGNITSYTYRKSIENIKTRLKILSDEDTVYAVKKNAGLEKKIGIFQDIEQKDDDLSEEKLNQTIEEKLKEISSPEISLSVEATGIPYVISGVGVYVIIDELGIRRTFWVDEDSHTFKGSSHTMSLTLNSVNE